MSEPPPPTAPGTWSTDPTQRFGQRWFDGTHWTDHAIGASGQPVVDTLPEGADFPPPAPPAALPPPPVAPYVPPYGDYRAPVGPGGPAGERYGPGLGLVIGVLGLIAVVLSLFVLKWFDTDKGSFLDLSSGARELGTSHLDGLGVVLAWGWDAFGGFVLFGLSVLLVVLAGIPLPGTRGAQQAWRIVGAVVAGGAAVLQANAFAGVPGDALEPGTWIGVAGFVLVGVGMIAGPRRVTR